MLYNNAIIRHGGQFGRRVIIKDAQKWGEDLKLKIENPKFVSAQHPQTLHAQKTAQKWGKNEQT